MAGLGVIEPHRDILLELITLERAEARLPVSHPLIRLDNGTKTECCTNAATSMLLGNPILSNLFYCLPNQRGLLAVIKGLSAARPTDVASLRNLRSHVVAAVPAAGECFAGYRRQQDSHEWLVYLFEGLEKEMPTNIKDPFLSMVQMQSEVTSHCTAAGHVKRKMEVDTILSVPVQHPVTEQSFNSLSQCLLSYFSEETVDVNCRSCQCDQACQSRRVIADPDVLLIHLKRFDRTGQRLGQQIEFKPELPGKSDDRPYVLTGIVLHDGETPQSGHYRTVIRCYQTGKLFLLDDSKEPRLLPMTDRVLRGMYQDAYIFLFSKEHKIRQQVSVTVNLTNRLLTELGMIGDHQMAEPVHCESTVGCDDVLNQPLHCDLDVEPQSVPDCEQLAMQEVIRSEEHTSELQSQ